jgi:tRNA threonylcarbamoyladenosine biosynthesis protein TsaE
VVIAAQGVPRDICALRIAKDFCWFRSLRQIVHTNGDDSQSACLQLGRPRAFGTVPFHIIHLAVPSGPQPGLQARLSSRQISVGDADGLKPQFGAPLLDSHRELSQPSFITPPFVTRLPQRLLDHPSHHSHASLALHLADEAATERLGQVLATHLAPGWRLYLSGDLGAGKTRLVRAILEALGHAGPVRSPSYALLESYVVSKLDLYHFDLYRFHSPAEWFEAGFDELLDAGSVCLVEWPEKAESLLPVPDLALRLVHAGKGRDVLISANTRAGARCVTELESLPGFS